MAKTKGLVLGKFMPLHNGHIDLIEAAALDVDELTILVCSIDADPIPGALRYHWMKEQFPKFRVLHITDNNPQEPEDHRFFWEIWINTIIRNCPEGVDTVFSSNNSGEQLAAKLNAKHTLIHLKKPSTLTSETEIRQNPWKHWEYIPAIVRPYYIKRVILTGPESTGKSVLSKKLAHHFKTTFVEEYGRTYCEEIKSDLDPIDFGHIAGGQMIMEDEAAKNANKVLFCDTDLIITQVWAEIYFNHCPQWIVEASHERHYDLFILLDVDIPWVNDGTRAFEKQRLWMWNRLRDELESRNLPYITISGGFESRFDQAVEAVEQLLLPTNH